MRKVNVAFFKRHLVADDDTIRAELAEPFATILSDELRRALIAKAGDELAEAVDETLRQRETDQDSRNDERPQGPDRLLWALSQPPAFLGVEVLVRRLW
jgi:hypothetical protein